MAYHFQTAYVPENIQSIKKYQRGGHKRLSGSVRKNEYHFSREWSVERVVSLKPGLGEGRSQVWWWGIRCIVRPIFPGVIFKDKRRKVDLFWWDGRKQLVEAVHMVDFVLQSWDRKGGKKPCWYLWTKCWMNKINSLQIPLILDIHDVVEFLQEVRVQVIVFACQCVKIH